MALLISSLLVECLTLFNALFAGEHLFANDTEIPKSLWLDELGRLRVWAANIGAHQTGQSSLDYRLRDASHIKDQVVRLLQRLHRLLVDLSEVTSDTLQEAEDHYSDDEDATELGQIYHGLVEVISSLFQMSMLIRRPARHDRVLGMNKEDYATFEPHDRQHVLEKCPRADTTVVDRLGSAISRRRAYLKYRERRHAKLSQGINHIQVAGDQESRSTWDRESTIFSETVATEYKEPNIRFDEMGSQSDVSHTSYASTLLESGGAITVPPPPNESANSFECPYCFFIITIENKRAWARHVFRDIMPYLCIFTDCPTPNRLYDSRWEWFQHLETSHISPSGACEPHECPLCRQANFSTLALEPHLGHHLEEIALFALPRSVGDEHIDSNRSRHYIGHDGSSRNCSDDSSRDDAAERSRSSIKRSAESMETFPKSIHEELLQRKSVTHDEKDYPVKCICSYADLVGDTVLCDQCQTWQHTVCYYPDEEEIPETPFCVDCKPRPLDRKRADDWQKRIRNSRSRVAPAQQGDTNARQGRPRRGTPGNDSSTDSFNRNARTTDARQEMTNLTEGDEFARSRKTEQTDEGHRRQDIEEATIERQIITHKRSIRPKVTATNWTCCHCHYTWYYALHVACASVTCQHRRCSNCTPRVISRPRS